MKENTFMVAQKIIGQERKTVAKIIGDALLREVHYEGAPGFAYTAGGWRIEKSGLVRSPESREEDLESITRVFEALKHSGVNTEDDFCVILSLAGYSGATLRNLINMIASKEKLLQKALGRVDKIIPQSLVDAINDSVFITFDDIRMATIKEAEQRQAPGDLWFDHLPEEAGLCFFNATLVRDEISAYTKLALQLSERAKTQEYASPRKKETDNDKYAMRVWLMRLGFIGDEYKAERKVLLQKLSGNAAFRHTERDEISRENVQN